MCSRTGSRNPAAPLTAGSIGQSRPCPLGAGHPGERAVAVSQNVPLILRGDAPVFSKSPQASADVDEELLARLADLYSKDDWLSATERGGAGRKTDGGGAEPEVGTRPRQRRGPPGGDADAERRGSPGGSRRCRRLGYARESAPEVPIMGRAVAPFWQAAPCVAAA